VGKIDCLEFVVLIIIIM